MRSFDDLVEDKEKRARIVFDIKKALESPLVMLRTPNYQILIYLCLDIPLTGKIPLPSQIARDLKIKEGTVRKAIVDFKEIGILVEEWGLQEITWRTEQIKIFERQFKEYCRIASKSIFDFKNTHKGKLNNAETDLMLTADMVHKAFEKAHNQYTLAINTDDKEATQQAYHFIELLKEWFNKINITDDPIKNTLTTLKLMYF